MAQPSHRPQTAALPDVLVIGAMKAASSTICRFLELHPQVYMLENCEPEFFSRDECWARGIDWYSSLFSGAPDEPLKTEGSNSYAMTTLYPHTVGRMKKVVPNAKLIYMVRHPVERILSAWIQRRTDSPHTTHPDPNEAVREDQRFFVDASRYWLQLSAFRQEYPDASIWVGFLEDLKTDAQSFFDELAKFLGLTPASELGLGPLHMNPSTRKLVPNRRYTAAHALPGKSLLSAILPTSIKQAIRHRFLSTRANGSFAFDQETVQWLAEELRIDSRHFLDFCRKPTTFWGDL